MRRLLFATLTSLAVACSSDPQAIDNSQLPQDDGGGTTGPDGSMVTGDGGPESYDSAPIPPQPPMATTSVQIIVEPSDNGAAIEAAISGATKSIHMTMYLLSSTNVVKALIARHKAGVDVKVILNQNFPQAGTDNSYVYGQLQSAGVPVVYASLLFTYTHEKCVIIDGTTAWIMTMNLTQSSPSSNREFLAIDTDPADVAEAETIFQSDYAHTKPAVSGKLLVAPVNAHALMLGLISTAKKSLDVEDESLSDWQVTDALVAAKKAGVAVRVVLSDQTPTAAQSTSIGKFKAAGIPVVSVSNPYIHAKAVVADGTLAYVGSENLTQNSLDSNRELGLVVGAASEVAKVASTVAADFSAGKAL